MASHRLAIFGGGLGEPRRVRLPPGELIEVIANGPAAVQYSFGNNAVFTTVAVLAGPGRTGLMVHPGDEVWVGIDAAGGIEAWVLVSGCACGGES